MLQFKKLNVNCTVQKKMVFETKTYFLQFPQWQHEQMQLRFNEASWASRFESPRIEYFQYQAVKSANSSFNIEKI